MYKIIIILIIICLVSVLIISLNLRSKRAISKENLPKASTEQGNKKIWWISTKWESAQNDNGNNIKDASNIEMLK